MILKFLFGLTALAALIMAFLILTDQWMPSSRQVAIWTALLVAIVYGHLASEERK